MNHWGKNSTMNLETAKSKVSAPLREKGCAANSAILALFGQDQTLLTKVREVLILDDFAKLSDFLRMAGGCPCLTRNLPVVA